MRHGQKGYKLGRTHSHRAATLAALSTALITHKRIRTTHTKAKALRQFIEPLITRSKTDSTHNRREVFRRLQDKRAVTELFTAIAEEVGDRPGGYTRIVKLGQRGGDGAEMAIIELVDYNDVKPEGGSSRRRRTRRGGGGGRRRGKGQGAAVSSAAPTKTTETQTEDQIIDENDQMEGVQTETVETPVAEEQTVPVPERAEEDETPDLAAEMAEASEEDEDTPDQPEASAEEDTDEDEEKSEG